MSQNISFLRKVAYIAAIALLLFPLFFLGQPATPDSAGGLLARLREEHDLSQASLGEIDPASESMKLATLGMRGVAAQILWHKAFEYKKKEDWDSLSATANQIIKLEPNYIMVWEFQSHNLAYNISVEFDDYRLRYHWVTKGLDYAIGGTQYNRDNPRLLGWVGWITGQKIGRADEHVQFRELFREDDDFHDRLSRKVVVDDALGYDGRPDNWLVGRLWYELAEDAIDRGGRLEGKSPLVFYAHNPMSLINYSSTIEEEGVFAEKAERAWQEADQAWLGFGRRLIPTTWGHNVRLDDYDKVRADAEQLRERLDEMLPGLREKIRQEKIAKLSEEQRAALELPEDELDDETARLHYDALDKTKVTHAEVADRAPESLRDQAVKLAGRIGERELLANRTAHYRGTINYEYWKTRCQAEQEKATLEARELVYQAKKAHEDAELETARPMYEQAWQHWKEVFDKYPQLMDDVEADDVIKAIKRYRRLLQQLDEDLPKDFILRDFILRRHDEDLEGLFESQSTSDAAGDSSESDDDGDT